MRCSSATRQCLTPAARIFPREILYHPSSCNNTLEPLNCATVRKWKCLFVNNCGYKSPICTATEFLTRAKIRKMSLSARGFIHSVVYLTKRPQPLPKRSVHTVRYSATSFSFLKVIQQLLTSFSLSSPHFYPSLYFSLNNVFIKQFLRKMWPIQLFFLLFIVCRIFLLYLTQCDNSYFSHDPILYGEK